MKTKVNYYLLGLTTFFVIIQSCKTSDLVKPDSPSSLNNSSSSSEIKANAGVDPGITTDGYIVILKSTSNTYKNNFKNSDKSYNGLKASMKVVVDTYLKTKNIKLEKTKRVFSSIPGFVVSLTDTEAQLLKKDPEIQTIEVNHVFNALKGTMSTRTSQNDITWNTIQSFNMFSEAIPPGVSRVNGGYINAYSGTNVWVVDSGCDLTHSELNIDQTRAASFVDTEPSAQDQNGHGTHVAGIIGAKINNVGIVGVAPNALIVPVKVTDQYGTGSDASILAGLDYVKTSHSNTNNIDIINLSVGSYNRNPSTMLDNEVIAVAESGVQIVIAAGNSGDDTQYYPMARVVHNGVYVIAAIDASNDNFCNPFPGYSQSSNYGASVTSAEPGSNIYSTWLNNSYQTESGTSMAAPHFTGLLAMPNTDDSACRIAPFSTTTTKESVKTSAYGYGCVLYPTESNANNVPVGGTEIIRIHQSWRYRSAN